MFIYCFLFCFYMPENIAFTGVNSVPFVYSIEDSVLPAQTKAEIYTPMEALDLLQANYAANFEKVYYAESAEYYYKLPFAEYYLIYEGTGETDTEYLIHLYEFVTDEPDTGVGHTVTYGWFTVNSKTGEITEYSND